MSEPNYQDFLNILQSRAGGAVQRAHTCRHFGSYSNAEHSWGVAMLLLHLYPRYAHRLIPYALVHDVPEGLTGDVPSTAKHEQDSELDDVINHEFGLPDLGELNPHDYAILKSCDRLELYFWAQEQKAMGNAFAQEFVTNLTTTFARDQEHSGLDPVAYQWYHRFVNGKSVVPDRSFLLAKIKERNGIR